MTAVAALSTNVMSMASWLIGWSIVQYQHVLVNFARVLAIGKSFLGSYEQKDFQAMASEAFPYLRWLLGFDGVTTMIKKI
jgi:hypothetical protein